MPTFNILLAYDTAYYGEVSVEADTWEEAVASLSSAADWYDNCFGESDDGWEYRVVDVKNDDGDIVAEDLSFDCNMVCRATVTGRLQHILDTCGMSEDTAKALSDFIGEIRTMGRDPVFDKEGL
jgi:hypothetical protein